ncbi:unnamed protein product [[Candida] boidinii]|nr:unnamed protein product [[Candida] boidinii]
MEEQEEEDSVEESKFGIPYYIDLLLSSKEEAENPISNIHLRAHQDRQLMFVEELSTISMIFRNISFVKDNNIVMAENSIFQDFIFKLIMSLASHPKKYKFSRKMLCLMKDSVITLTNVAHGIQLKSSLEALLIYVLIIPFGGKLTKFEQESGLLIPEYSHSINKFQHHCIDIFTKFIVGSTVNRSLMLSVSNGFPSDSLILADPRSVKLLKRYIEFLDCSFIDKVFGFLLSIIPFKSLHKGIDPIQPNLPTIFEALLSSNIITEALNINSSSTIFTNNSTIAGLTANASEAEDEDMEENNIVSAASMEKSSASRRNKCIQWLNTPELIGSGLLKLGLMYTTVSTKTHSDERHLYVSIASKSLELLNNLLENALDSELTESELVSLYELPHIFPNLETFMVTLATPNIEPKILTQIVQLSKHIGRLNVLVKNIVN